MGERFHVVKLSGEDAAELLVLVPGGVWAPIEFLPAACRYERHVAERWLGELPGAFMVRAACECARCRRSAASAERGEFVRGLQAKQAGRVVVVS